MNPNSHSKPHMTPFSSRIRMPELQLLRRGLRLLMNLLLLGRRLLMNLQRRIHCLQLLWRLLCVAWMRWLSRRRGDRSRLGIGLWQLGMLLEMRLERVGPWTMWLPNQQMTHLPARLWRSLARHRRQRMLLFELVAASAGRSRLGFGLWWLELQLELVGLTRWRGRQGCGLVFETSE